MLICIQYTCSYIYIYIYIWLSPSSPKRIRQIESILCPFIGDAPIYPCLLFLLFFFCCCCCCCCCFDCLWDDPDWRMWCLWIAGCPCTEKGSCSNCSSRETISVSTFWLFNIAIGNGPFIDGLPIKNVQNWTNYLFTIPRISVGHVKHSGHCPGRLLAKKCVVPYRKCRCLVFFSGFKKNARNPMEF